MLELTAPKEGGPTAVCVALWPTLCEEAVALLAGPLGEAGGGENDPCGTAAAVQLPEALSDCNGAGVVDSVAPPVENGEEDGSPLGSKFAVWEGRDEGVV